MTFINLCQYFLAAMNHEDIFQDISWQERSKTADLVNQVDLDMDIQLAESTVNHIIQTLHSNGEINSAKQSSVADVQKVVSQDQLIFNHEEATSGITKEQEINTHFNMESSDGSAFPVLGAQYLPELDLTENCLPTSSLSLQYLSDLSTNAEDEIFTDLYKSIFCDDNCAEPEQSLKLELHAKHLHKYPPALGIMYVDFVPDSEEDSSTEED